MSSGRITDHFDVSSALPLNSSERTLVVGHSPAVVTRTSTEPVARAPNGSVAVKRAMYVPGFA